MKKVIAVLFLFAQSVWACPNCAGSQTASDKYTFLFLGGFILLTYIPFYILFRIAKTREPKGFE